MARIVNNYRSPLIVGSVEIAPGSTGDVEDWSEIKGEGLYPRWLEAGVIAEQGASEPEPEPDVARDQLIADMEEFGLSVDKRKSTDTLKAELEAATAPDAG